MSNETSEMTAEARLLLQDEDGAMYLVPLTTLETYRVFLVA